LQREAEDLPGCGFWKGGVVCLWYLEGEEREREDRCQTANPLCPPKQTKNK
jgi:hypothetical protein